MVMVGYWGVKFLKFEVYWESEGGVGGCGYGGGGCYLDNVSFFGDNRGRRRG